MLANAVGIKVGDRETRDIVDIFAIADKRVQRARLCRSGALASATTRRCRRPSCVAAARNREATARYAWSPYMHNPKLKGRLHRITIPTLFLWGAADRILSRAVRPRLCRGDSRARASRPIEGAGHFPHLEQPEEFARARSTRFSRRRER